MFDEEGRDFSAPCLESLYRFAIFVAGFLKRVDRDDLSIFGIVLRDNTILSMPRNYETSSRDDPEVLFPSKLFPTPAFAHEF